MGKNIYREKFEQMTFDEKGVLKKEVDRLKSENDLIRAQLVMLEARLKLIRLATEGE